MSDIKEQIDERLQPDGSIRKFKVTYRIEEHDSRGLPDGLSWVTVLNEEEIKDA